MKIKRERIIMFRASTLEKRIIEKRAYESGTTTADFCRRAALGKEIGYRLGAQDPYRNQAKLYTHSEPNKGSQGHCTRGTPSD